MTASSVFSRLAWISRPRLAGALLMALVFANAVGCVTTRIDTAAGNCDVDGVKSLVQANPELISSKDTSGHTPLHYAAYRGCTNVAQYLIDNHAEVNARDNDGWTPLHYAAYYGHLPMAQLLLANKADVNARDNTGLTPLQVAAINGYPEMADTLLGHDAVLRAKDDTGLTALHWSVSSRYRDVEDLLRRRGALDGD